jgi:ketosteroid isomerase-like protein
MSQENMDRLREAVEAINRHDIDGALNLSHPDIEWQTLDAFPDAGTYHGPEGVRSFFQTWLDTFKGFRLHLEKCEAVDNNRVLARFRVSGRVSKAGLRSSRPRSFSCLSTATA